MALKPSHRASLAERKAAIYRGRVRLYKSALGWVLLALLHRLLAFNALVYAKGRFLPFGADQHLRTVQHVLGWVQFIVSVPPLFSNTVRKAFPGTLLLVLALLSGTLAALSTRSAQAGASADRSTKLLDQPLSSSDFTMTMVMGLSPNDVFQVSMDTQPTVFIVLPLAVALALVLPVLGSHLGTPLLAAALPYAITKAQLALAGWEDLSLGASIGSVLSGIFSLAGTFWLLSTLWKFTGGRSLVNYDIELRDPVKGADPHDALYLAAWAFHSYLLMPLWLLVLGIRTWLWVSSCGAAFSRPPLPIKHLNDD